MVDILAASEVVLLLRLQDDLKMENVREFFEIFAEELQSTHKEVILDLSRIRFVDSSGVGILLKCNETLKAQDARLLVCGLNKALLSVFKLGGLTKILSVHELEELAGRFPELTASD